MRTSGFIKLAVAGLLAFAACAYPEQVAWPDSSQMIEVAMAPPAPGEKIPEGIALGEDAPPLAEPDPATTSETYSLGWGSWGGFYGLPAHPGARPPLPAGEPLIKARPGGSIPGLLP